MSPDDDPDFSGRVATKAMRPESPDGRMTSIGRWVVVFVVNLVIPLILGLSVAKGDARIGMVLGIAILLGLGCWASLASRTIGMALSIGGSIVALSQFLPFLQFIAGSIAVDAAGLIEVADRRSGLTLLLSGLVATIVTGGLLMGIALALGLPILRMTSWFVPKDADPEESLEEKTIGSDSASWTRKLKIKRLSATNPLRRRRLGP